MYKVSYVGDGATSEFLFAFPFFQKADIRIAIDETLLPPDVYSVIPNDDFTGGRVVLQSVPSGGANIDIFRQIALSRVVDYQPTARIDPEHLNADFNFLLEALRDIYQVDIDITEWKNHHDTVKQFLDYTLNVVQDKLSGGGVLGLYNNLLNVLDSALPKLVNDYGYITEPANNELNDDYGTL